MGRRGVGATLSAPARYARGGDAALPRTPVLGWDSWWPCGAAQLPNIGELPHTVATTSGRAALVAALRQQALPAGSVVLVPSYHCPTMVAPVLHCGLQSRFFSIGADGLPLLDSIEAAVAASARVMFVAHYFGIPQSLAAVRQWCSEHNIVLVEDCAHSYFGMAGERPVGTWGDYATASLSKFFPLPEGGLLASAHGPLRAPGLTPAGWRAQVKAGVDVLERAQQHRRLAGVRQLVTPLMWAKNRRRAAKPSEADAAPVPPGDNGLPACDMARTEQRATWLAHAMHAVLPQRPIVRARRSNYARLAQQLRGLPGTYAFMPGLPEAAAPYAFALVIESEPRADAVYAQLRREQLPVFRWDRIWPGTASAAGDHGARWSRTLLQLLVHQSLSTHDIDHLAERVQALLQARLP